jgi:hypothetical protein
VHTGTGAGSSAMIYFEHGPGEHHGRHTDSAGGDRVGPHRFDAPLLPFGTRDLTLGAPSGRGNHGRRR